MSIKKANLFVAIAENQGKANSFEDSNTQTEMTKISMRVDSNLSLHEQQPMRIQEEEKIQTKNTTTKESH